MKIIKTIFAAAAVMLGMASCNESSTENTWTLNYTNNYTYVINTDDNSEYLGAGADYTMKVDLDAGMVDVTITDLILGPSQTPVSIKLEKTKYTNSKEGAMVVSAPRFQSVVGSQTHEITSFTLTHMRRTLVYAGVVSDLYTVTFIVDGKYVVRAIQRSTILVGETTVVDMHVNASEKQTRPYYYYELDLNSRKARVVIGQLRYGGVTHPEITLTDIPFTVNNSGFSIVAAGDIVPQMGSALPADNVVRNFSAIATYVPTMNVTFDIAGRYDVSAVLNATGVINPED